MFEGRKLVCIRFVYIKMYLTVAEVYLRAGQREEARQVVVAAGGLVERRAELIQDEAVRERYLTRVSYNARVLELLRSLV